MDQKEAKRLEVNTRWNGKANVCVHCGRVPETFYIVTGHDHTDDDIKWCPCRDVSEIERLRAENDALRKDAERLDWLGKSSWYVGPGDFYCTEGGDIVDYDDKNFGTVQLREAIDAAMKGE